jgi:hypothetical protein
MPHEWCLIKTPEGCRVFGSWRGSYTEGSSWRCNSGIAKVEETELHYVFHGNSGSLYKCNKTSYGVYCGYNLATLNSAYGPAVLTQDQALEWIRQTQKDSVK